MRLNQVQALVQRLRTIDECVKAKDF
jgi:hypothetical protein